MLRRFIPRLRAQAINAIPLITHALGALLPLVWAKTLANSTVTLPEIALVAFCGNLPDIDTSYSHIGRLLWPLSRFIERRFGHRTVTHSLLALGLVTAAAYAARYYVPIAWPWAPLAYASHLLLDMIVGGSTGVPLLWPAKHRFYLLEITPGGTGERLTALALAMVCLLPLVWGVPDPARILHERAGTLDFAIQDYRQWEGAYRVYADVEGQWQADHRRESGRFEIIRAEGQTLTLTDGERVFTAGQTNEDFYIRRIVAIRGEPLPPIPPPTPPPEAPPATVKIVIYNVYDPATEILVQPGDVITAGQVIADLAGYRRALAEATPTPSPEPTPTWQPDPLRVAYAQAKLDLARAEATRVAEPPSAEAIAIAKARLAMAQADVDAAQRWLDILEPLAEYDPWHDIPYLVGSRDGPVGKRSDLNYREALAQARHDLADAQQRLLIAQAEATRTAQGPSQAELEAALANIRVAEVDLQRALATPTPAPTFTPTPAPEEEADPTIIYPLVDGIVTGWRIVSVRNNIATVEVYVEVAPYAPFLTPSPSPSPLRARVIGERNRGAYSAPSTTYAYPLRARVDGEGIVVGITDGDTIRVLLAGREETVRLTGVNTPETTKGNMECYGPEAVSFVSALLAGKKVGLEYDVALRDKYGRILAYVWLDNEMVNAKLVAAGYARAMKVPPNVRYAELFQQLEDEARVNQRGLWRECQ